MWLDRLSSGHSTPAATPSGSPPPTNRTYSPAPPRRPSHLGPASAAQRPGFNARSSSLSINSNDSTTSLLPSSRKANGSGLKQSVTVADVRDPLEVLEKLLGSEGTNVQDVSKSKSTVNGTRAAEAEDEEELDFEGLSLHELVSRKLDPEVDAVYTPQTTEECKCRILLGCSNLILFSLQRYSSVRRAPSIDSRLRRCS